MAKRGRGRPPKPEDERKESTAGVKLTRKRKAWLVELANHCGLSITETVVRALIYFARLKRFRKPPNGDGENHKK